MITQEPIQISFEKATKMLGEGSLKSVDIPKDGYIKFNGWNHDCVIIDEFASLTKVQSHIVSDLSDETLFSYKTKSVFWLIHQIEHDLQEEGYNKILLNFDSSVVEQAAWDDLISELEARNWIDNIEFVGLTEHYQGLLDTWRFKMNPNTTVIDVKEEASRGELIFDEPDVWDLLDFIDILLGEGEDHHLYLFDFGGFKYVEYEAFYLLLDQLLEGEYPIERLDFDGRSDEMVRAMQDFLEDLEGEDDPCQNGTCDCDEYEEEDEEYLCELGLCDCNLEEDEEEEELPCDCGYGCDGHTEEPTLYDRILAWDAEENKPTFHADEFIVSGLGVYYFWGDSSTVYDTYDIEPKDNLLES